MISEDVTYHDLKESLSDITWIAMQLSNELQNRDPTFDRSQFLTDCGVN